MKDMKRGFFVNYNDLIAITLHLKSHLCVCYKNTITKRNPHIINFNGVLNVIKEKSTISSLTKLHQF